ncbi:MAG: hypothetical protein RL326_1297, partial [Pseudomonadota bacterium]
MSRARVAHEKQRTQDWITRSRWHLIRVSSILSLLQVLLPLIIPLLASEPAVAQTGTASYSSATLIPTDARHSFQDSESGTSWTFWHTGSQLDYASSATGTSWTTRGSVECDTPNFFVTLKVISGIPYVFLVAETSAQTIEIWRGTSSGTTIAFDSEVTILDRASESAATSDLLRWLVDDGAAQRAEDDYIYSSGSNQTPLSVNDSAPVVAVSSSSEVLPQLVEEGIVNDSTSQQVLGPLADISVNGTSAPYSYENLTQLLPTP